MILVTGGGGFIGHAIVELLRARSEPVRSFSRQFHPRLDALGVEQFAGHLDDVEAVSRATEGCDLVFHVAALASTSTDRVQFERTNVDGTRNVIAACRRHQVRDLVFTSSPAVVFDGRDIEGGDETMAIPSHYEADYPRTKAQAERMILEADGDQLRTVALRPHLVWGPGDTQLAPRLLARHRAGRLRRFSGPVKLIDPTYIDDVASAHLAAADRLRAGDSALRGRTYFVTSGDPIPIWDMVNAILRAGGAPPLTRSVSPSTAFVAGAVCEAIWRGFRLRGEPPMSRWVARKFSTSCWFDISAARRDLGWSPKVPREVGLQRLADSLVGARD